MAYDETLAGRIRDAVAHTAGITEKKMFGGVGFLLNGNLLTAVWMNCLIVRVGVDAAEKGLSQPHVGPMDLTGKPMKGWLMIQPAGIATDKALRSWIKTAMKFVSTLPAK